MTNDDFIDILQEQGLVSTAVVRQLREKASKGDARVTPKSILKYLVKKDLVSRDAAKGLLETSLVVSEKAESSILGLAPLADVETPAPKALKAEKRDALDQETIAGRRATKQEPVKVGAVDDEVLELTPIAMFEEAPTGAPAKGSAVEEPPQRADDELSADNPRPPRALRSLNPKKSPKKDKRPSKKAKGKNEWESPLLLIGGGGLAILVLSSVVLWWLVFREGADAALKKANDSFAQGQYPLAIELYKGFMESYPRHQDFSYAKVRMGLTRLWQDAESRNYAGVADNAPAIIGEIENEPAFIANPDDPEGGSDAKNELASLLTKTAQGLAEQAESAKSEEVAQARIKQLNTILELISNTKYVPQKLRQDSALEDVRQTLQRVETRQRRDADLAAALAKMDDAIKGGKPAEALAVRASLLRNYPVLVEDKSLSDKVLEASKAEQAAIKFVEGRKTAQTEGPQTPVVAELALADRRGAAAGNGAPLAVRVDGAVYGLNSGDGALLWRRFVGLDGAALPLALPEGNVVAVDSQHGELVCLNAQTGKLVWRQPLEGKLATPVLAGDRLLAASDAGKLFVLNHSSGELLGSVPFSQPLRAPPAVSEQGDRIYVLGEHSNVYTLNGSDFACLGVYYLGHSAGGVVVPAETVVNKLMVADNSGAETCTVRALTLNERGIITGELTSQRLNGLVTTPMQTAGRRLAVVTTLGQAMVFEVGPGSDKSSVAIIAKRDASEKEPMDHYALLHEGHLWIAGHQLMKLAILPTGNQLPTRTLDRNFRGDAFDYPLQAVGNLVVHVHRPAGQGGDTVSAMDAAANRSLWDISLAVPPAGAPAADPESLRLVAGSVLGAVYQLDREAMTRRVQDQAQRLDGAAPKTPLADSLDLGQGRLVLGGVGATQMICFVPTDARQPLKAVELPGPATSPPVAWRDGFAVPTEVGQVALYQADGSALATPFQPELTPGRKYEWLRPAVTGTQEQSQLIVSDGVAKLYLVNFELQPQPHLKAAAAADVGATPLETPLAVAGTTVYGGNKKGQLSGFTLPGLTAKEPVDLGGRVVWGPHPTGDGLLLTTERNELLFIASDGAIRWRQPVKHGELAGAPLVDGPSIFVLSRNGGIARINLADGAEAAYSDFAEPAVAGPVAFGPRLVISAHDGTLLVVNRP